MKLKWRANLKVKQNNKFHLISSLMSNIIFIIPFLFFLHYTKELQRCLSAFLFGFFFFNLHNS